VTCEELKQLLPGYVRGTLSGEEEQTVRIHLEQCARCLRDVEDLQWIRDTLHDYPEEYVFTHVSPGDLIAYGDDRETLSAETIVFIEKHLSVCGRCSREFKVLKAVNTDLHLQEIQKQTRFFRIPVKITDWLKNFFTRPSKSVRRLQYAVLVATVIVALVTFPKYFTGSESAYEIPPTTGTERGGTDNHVTLLEPRDQEIVTVVNPVFRWKTESRVLHYLFYIYTEDGTLIWKTETDTNQVHLPGNRRLQNNQRYVWGVDALLGPETTIESGLFQFETRFDSTPENNIP